MAVAVAKNLDATRIREIRHMRRKLGMGTDEIARAMKLHPGTVTAVLNKEGVYGNLLPWQFPPMVPR